MQFISTCMHIQSKVGLSIC